MREMSDLSWIEDYVYVFAKRWKPYLDEHLELRAEVYVGNRRGMIAIEFFPADKTDPWELNPKNDSWQYILEQVGKALPQPMEISQILMDGIVYVVTDEAVTVIKRNEKHLWTRSLAREDAEATLCKRMIEICS